MDAFIVSVNKHICQTWANKFVSFTIWCCGLLPFCLYRVKWNLRASGTVPLFHFGYFGHGHSIRIHRLSCVFACIHDRYGSCFRSMTLFSSIHNKRLMFQIKIDLFAGKGEACFSFLRPCNAMYTNFRLCIWHRYIDTHRHTRWHMNASTQKYTQSKTTKQSRAIIQKMSEMERIVTMCPLNERGWPTHTHTHTRTNTNRCIRIIHIHTSHTYITTKWVLIQFMLRVSARAHAHVFQSISEIPSS